MPKLETEVRGFVAYCNEFIGEVLDTKGTTMTGECLEQLARLKKALPDPIDWVSGKSPCEVQMKRCVPSSPKDGEVTYVFGKPQYIKVCIHCGWGI